MTGSKVVALGHYQPERVLTNAELSTMVETNDEWIQSRVGIKERRIAAPDEQVDEMAWRAAEKAIANSGLDTAEIDMVVVATCTAIDRSPNIAARVAARLGLSTPAALDVNTACSGFSHALATADHAIRAGAASKALVIGVEKLSDFTDWTDRTTCVLIGDGAGAAVLVATDEPEIGPVVWGSVPEMSDAVRIEGRDGKFAQEGQSVFRWTTTQLPVIARQVCEKGGVTPEEPRRRRPAPGQPEDHRAAGQAPRRGQRGGRARCRRVRQHLGGEHPDRLVEAGRAPRDPRRRPGPPLRLRRRPLLRRPDHPLPLTDGSPLRRRPRGLTASRVMSQFELETRYHLHSPGGVVRPPERWTTPAAGIAGLVLVLLTLPLAIDDHTTGDTRYDDAWSPVIGLVISLWLVLIGIAIKARRTAI